MSEILRAHVLITRKGERYAARRIPDSSAIAVTGPNGTIVYSSKDAGMVELADDVAFEREGERTLKLVVAGTIAIATIGIAGGLAKRNPVALALGVTAAGVSKKIFDIAQSYRKGAIDAENTRTALLPFK